MGLNMLLILEDALIVALCEAVAVQPRTRLATEICGVIRWLDILRASTALFCSNENLNQ